MSRLALLAIFIALLVVLALPAAAGASGYVYETTIGSSGAGLGQLDAPEGLTVDGHGVIYVGETSNARVQRFTTDGAFIDAVGGPGSALGQFNNPCALLIDSTGKLLVGEYVTRMQVLTTGLTPLSTWGTSGTGDYGFGGINQIAKDSAGNIYVTEYWNNRVHVFDPAYTYLRQWSVTGASGIAIDENDVVYVASWGGGTISRFDTAGTPIGAPFAGTGTDPGKLMYPSNMAFAPDGSLLVGESNNYGRISRFDAETGDFMGIVATTGTGPGQLDSVWGIAVDEHGDLFACDYELDKVVKYAWDDTPPVIDHNYDGEWHSDSVTVTFSATDDVATLPWLRWSSDNGATWTDGGTMTVTADPATHAWDGVNSRTISAGDTTDNWAYRVLRVKIDTRAPHSTISGLPASGISGHEVYPAIAATDIGSGVRRIYYDLDDAGLTELPDSGVVPIETAGLHTLKYWAEDNCADTPNQESANSVEVKVDMMGPTAFPRYRVSVRRGAKATFKYGLVDDLSDTCSVKLVIKKKTKVVKTVNLGVRDATFQVPEHRYAKTLRITLPAGTYSWTVVAVDQGGNVGSYAPKRLTVRP